MLCNTVNPNLLERSFFANNYNLSIKFSRNGDISGNLCLFPDDNAWMKAFKGIYVYDKSKITISFMVDWSNKDLLSNVLTCYHGVIFNYEEQFECLVLKWLQINESLSGIGSFVYTDGAVLFDRPDRASRVETKVLLETIDSL